MVPLQPAAKLHAYMPDELLVAQVAPLASTPAFAAASPSMVITPAMLTRTAGVGGRNAENGSRVIPCARALSALLATSLLDTPQAALLHDMSSGLEKRSTTG